jgi:hypothetical protein
MNKYPVDNYNFFFTIYQKIEKSLKEVDTATIWALTTVLVLAMTKTYIFNSGTLNWLKTSYCTRIHPGF